MSRKPKSPRAPSSIDRTISKRILELRNERGVTQMVLADKIGVTFQQVQKYERGTNRVSASRLYLIAGVLDVPLDAFFEQAT